MKRSLFLAASLVMTLLSCTDDREVHTQEIVPDPEAELIHYWNFNQVSGTVTSIDADFSQVSGASISYPGSGSGYMDAFDPGYDVNARNGDAAGSGIRARNPSDTRSLVFALPTTGFRNILVQFAASRSGSGAQTQNYSYSTDGINYTSDGLAVTSFNPSEDPLVGLVQLDFSAITTANDNPDFKLRIEFSGDAASGTSGNDRFDNVTVEGIPTDGSPGPGPGPDPTVYLFHYWNFNSAASGTLSAIAPDVSLIAGASAAITYPGTGAGYMDAFSPGSAENSRNGDEAGSGIRMRNPSNTRDMLVTASTAGYQNVIVRFATAKSSASGAATQQYSYTTDGIGFTDTDLATLSFSPDIDPNYTIVTLDFSNIPAADNNPVFAVRIRFTGTEAAGSSGNNRFDNLTFEGNSL